MIYTPLHRLLDSSPLKSGIGYITWTVLLVSLLLISGCAKHGMAVATGADHKGRISVGWGPMTVIDADVAGEFKLCIPSKNAFLQDDPAYVSWCSEWMKTP